MAFKLVYQAQISWVGAGAGPMEALAPSSGNFMMGGSTGQSKGFTTNPAVVPVVAGAGAGGTLAAGDITTLTNGMAADIAAQMNLPAVLAQINGWPTGTP